MLDTMSFIEEKLKKRKELQEYRFLRTLRPLDGLYLELDGRRLLNFSSNDYLGLSKEISLIKRGFDFAERYGAGAGASRLVSANFSCMEELEGRIASMKGFESSLLISSGYQANISLIPALFNRDSLIFIDRLAHNSLLQGVRLSMADFSRFRHNDLSHLESLLARAPENKRKCIISESVFSMDGDLADIEALSRLARKYKAFLIIDEAHATGVFGENGMGLVKSSMADLVLGTFSKASGSFGAYIAASDMVKEYLVNYMTAFIFSTALPPFLLGMIDAGLDCIRDMSAQRSYLQDLALYFRKELKKLGYNTGDSLSQIVPLILGESSEALALSEYLEKKGFLAVAIRPPSVAAGESRIRFSLSALHEKEELDELLYALKVF